MNEGVRTCVVHERVVDQNIGGIIRAHHNSVSTNVFDDTIVNGHMTDSCAQ